MAYIQLKINMVADHVQALGDMLTGNGAQAVTYVDAKDTPLFELQPGEVLLWPDTQVIGLFSASDDMQAIINRLAKLHGMEIIHPFTFPIFIF